jgi:predicted dehydrogenase
MRTIRVGVAGVGALGKAHARIYGSLGGAQLAGVFDVDRARAKAVAAELGCPVFDTLDGLLRDVEALSIATPTLSHHAVARQCIGAGRDVLVEKPITHAVEEGEDLVRFARERGVILQVGHVERFNPAAEILKSAAVRPRFVEVHRLGVFSARSLDIDVVLDLMIHDLDLLLALDPTPAVQIDAVGVPVLTDKVDIANARVRFASGLIANLTASRVSAERVRKFRVFFEHGYVSADLAAREAKGYRLVFDAQGAARVIEERFGATDQEPLRSELEAFVASVRERAAPKVSGEDGLRALTLARAILARMADG